MARLCPGAQLSAGGDVEEAAPAPGPALLAHVLGGQAAQALDALHVLSDELPVNPPEAKKVQIHNLLQGTLYEFQVQFATMIKL